MFIGHWAPAFAAAALQRAPRLPVLALAAQVVDWLFFALLPLGIERMRVVPGISTMNPMDLYHLPYTHSLSGGAAIGVLFALACLGFTGNRRGALIAGLVVLSHWALDWLVHVPDLTLAGSPPKLGLGLWNRPAIAIPLELGLIGAGLWLYTRAMRPSAMRLAVFALVLLAVQLVNWFGPPPQAVTLSLSLTALAAFGLVTLLAWWLDTSTNLPRAGLAIDARRG